MDCIEELTEYMKGIDIVDTDCNICLKMQEILRFDMTLVVAPD